MSAKASGREMASLASELHGIVTDVTGESRQELQQIRDLLAQSISTLDSSFNAIARGVQTQQQLATQLLDHLAGTDSEAGDMAGLLEKNSGGIHDHVAAAVRSLQFEDMVRQVLEHVEQRLAALDEATSRLASQAEAFITLDAADHHGHLGQLREQLGAAREKLHSTDHRAVIQSSIDEGEIDLF